jgi:hypothetical protein
MPVVSLKDAGAYFSPTGPLAQQMKQAAIKGLFSAALRAKRDIVSRVIPQLGGNKPIDRGIYRAGWQVQKLPTGAALYNPVPTAGMIEYGVPANNVVASNKAHLALAEWVQRKLGGRRGKPVSVDAMRGTTQKVNEAKQKFDQAKKTWTERSKSAMAKGKPQPPRPKAPGVLTSKGRAKHDFGFAWSVAGAILASMKKKGIFNRGQGLRVLENYTRSSLPSVIREEVERELAKVSG